MHNYELEKSGHVIWHLDYGMSGVGSNSCGPELLKQYRLNEEKDALGAGDWLIAQRRMKWCKGLCYAGGENCSTE